MRRKRLLGTTLDSVAKWWRGRRAADLAALLGFLYAAFAMLLATVGRGEFRARGEAWFALAVWRWFALAFLSRLPAWQLLGGRRIYVAGCAIIDALAVCTLVPSAAFIFASFPKWVLGFLAIDAPFLSLVAVTLFAPPVAWPMGLPVCQRCGYLLVGSRTNRCSECGESSIPGDSRPSGFWHGTLAARSLVFRGWFRVVSVAAMLLFAFLYWLWRRGGSVAWLLAVVGGALVLTRLAHTVGRGDVFAPHIRSWVVRYGTVFSVMDAVAITFLAGGLGASFSASTSRGIAAPAGWPEHAIAFLAFCVPGLWLALSWVFLVRRLRGWAARAVQDHISQRA